MQPLRFVPEHAIAGIPNVVVDGSANADTVLTLSHWPGSPTPPELRDDLSAQIAFRALAEPQRFDGIEAVTNNHFDQDGLASVFALTSPDLALPRREALIDLARAGDFGTFEARHSARLAMVIAALDDDERSPLAAHLHGLDYPQRCGALYEWALPRLPEIMDHPDRWQHLWEAEDAHLGESLHAIAHGTVRVEEEPALDLAIVHVPEDWATKAASRFTIAGSSAVHPMAVNSSTRLLRVATIQGQMYRVELRYETWVMLTSRRVMPRPDLRPLAEELTALDATPWRADAPGALTPVLQTEGGNPSTLAPDKFLTVVRQFLQSAAPAWDPFPREQ